MNMNSVKLKDDLAFIWRFSKDDFKNKFAGSVLGTVWAFVQPLMTVVIYWFVFEVGFKNQPVNGYPYVLWLMTGLFSWFFFSDAISSSTACLVEYSYLVKKVLFDINILPLIKICSVFYVQIFLLAFNTIVFLCCGYSVDLYVLQVLYYVFYMFIFVTGISYFTAALYVFFRDISQIISIVLQVIFWTTPFVWNIDIMPEAVRKVIRFIPTYYIVTGYRDSFIHKVGFWENPGMCAYYWMVSLLIFVAGILFFKKLKPHFADVL